MVSQKPSGNADGSNHLRSDDKKSVSFIGFNKQLMLFGGT